MNKEIWVIIGLLVLIIVSSMFMGSSYGDIYEGNAVMNPPTTPSTKSPTTPSTEQQNKLKTFKENVTKGITENMNAILLIIQNTDKSKLKNDQGVINAKLDSIKTLINDSKKILESK